MAHASDFHEDFSRQDVVAAGSDRNFGLTFAAILGAVGVLPLIHGAAPRLWAVGGAVLFLLAALLRPKMLAPLKLAWMRFGLVLHAVVTPVVMGLIFFAAVTPTGIFLRALGKDMLRLQRDPAAASYWIARDPPGPPPGSIHNQF